MPSFNEYGRIPARKLVLLALMIALSMGLHAAENMLPFLFPMPGIKLGLANIITVMCLYLFQRREVLIVVILRVILVGLIAGSLLTPGFWISGSGAFLSFLAMAAVCRFPKFSSVGVSLVGAAAHNIGQLMMVALLMGSRAVFFYLPWLLFWAVPMGLLTGFSAKAAIKALRKTGLDGTIEP